MKDGLDRTSKKIDKKRQKLHALECATGCTSWICNNWTAGLTAGWLYFLLDLLIWYARGTIT